MMKLLKLVLVIVAAATFAVSCNDEENVILGFSINKENITIGSEGGVDTINVTSSDVWVAISSEPWITISPANGVGNTECKIVIDSSLINGLRTATIRFSVVGNQPKEVAVYQTGFDKQIYIEEPNIEIEPSAKATERKFKAKITTNVKFDVSIEYAEGEVNKWLTVPKYSVDLERGARPRTIDMEFDWKMNTNFTSRVAKIHFTPSNPDDTLAVPATLVVTQKAAPVIEDNRTGDSLALITIAERIEYLGSFDPSENLRNWSMITLWESTDTSLPCAEAVGRVRSFEFFMMNTKESIPQEVKYLKYAEKIKFYGNVNTMLISIPLDTHVCNLEYLKDLEIGAYGLVSLPKEFKKLGNSLERLCLEANNFDRIPEILTPENFPNLKTLIFTANKRWTTSDLRKADSYADKDGLGLHINTSTSNDLERLFLWENLQELRLSNNYIEGKLPDFRVGVNGVKAYTQEDVDKFGGDTIQNLVKNNIPKILPNMKDLRINLNYLTGELPQWLLYHPYLLEWYPESLVFDQQYGGVDSQGKVVGFSNVPTDYEYYYKFFPGYKEKYEIKEVNEE